jgi:RNA polymerase sigma-70 factor, ECF subfamily
VNERAGTVRGVTFNEVTLVRETRADLETVFHAQYKRVCRVIARVLRDPGRAEEVAVEVFLKWSRHPEAQGDNADGWLYRTALREALDELRRQLSRAKYERLFAFLPVRLAERVPTPEDVRAAKADQEAVRRVLAVIKRRYAQLLILRSEGFSYAELASALELNPSSVGTLLARAERAFRKEYIKRYGDE